jgi:phosphoglycerate dehydrogenase-like enzyme
VSCRHSLSPAVLDQAASVALDRRLVVVGRAATSANSFDHDAARDLGVAIRTTPGANAAGVAALMIDALRGISKRSAAFRGSSWDAAVRDLPAGSISDHMSGWSEPGAVALYELVAALGGRVNVQGSPRRGPAAVA